MKLVVTNQPKKIIVNGARGVAGTGSVNADWDAVSGSSLILNKPTNTSDFINDGEDGTPFLIKPQGIVYVESLDDLPTPISNVITLGNDITYFFTQNLDLEGNRLVGGSNTVLIGGSSENAKLTSTGLGVGVPLFTSMYTTPIRHLSFTDVDTAISFDGSMNGNDMALDWTGVNFVNIPNIGIVKDGTNFIFDKGAFLNSKGLYFDGQLDTVGFGNCLFSGDGLLGEIIELAPTLTITRRFRIIYSSVVAFGSTIGIKVDAATTIGIERFILDTVNFSGGGTYLSGISYSDETALFVSCVGVVNTTAIANLYMKNNATPTPIAVIGNRYAMLGTTETNGNNQKFTHILANNSMRYDSTITRLFRILATFTIESGNNNICGLYIGVKRGGSINPTIDRISESEVYVTTSGTRPDVGSVQALVSLNQNDEVYFIVQNTSSTSSITIEFLNMIIERTN